MIFAFSLERSSVCFRFCACVRRKVSSLCSASKAAASLPLSVSRSLWSRSSSLIYL